MDDLQAVFDNLVDLTEPICQAIDSAKADMTVFPDEDKSVHDSKLLIPTLKDFFGKHPLIHPKVFLGDAAFDAIQLYKDLLTGDTFGENKHFSQCLYPFEPAGTP